MVPEGRNGFFTESLVLETLDVESFSWILLSILERKEIEEIARKTGVRAQGGVQFRNMSPWELGDFVASLALEDAKFLKTLCKGLRERLPEPLFPGQKLTDATYKATLDLLPDLPYEAPLRLLLKLLAEPNAKTKARLLEVIDTTTRIDEEAERAEREERARAPAPEPKGAEALAAARREREEALAKAAALEREAGKHREELERLRRELDELRRRLGEANENNRKLQAALQAEDQARREADRRAAEHKRQKEEALAPSEREVELRKALEEARRETQTLREKVEVLEEEVALTNQPDEEPATSRGGEDEEVALAPRVHAFTAKRGRKPAILVIGGARKQYSHRAKFEALKERLGFEGDWEWADYEGWHRRMKSLRNDMDRRYDALVILHWNRTTFVENAREVADRAGRLQRTVQYRGFLSLRKAILELLRYLVER
jgi:hypothetical protein